MKQIIEKAAKAAYDENIDAGNEEQLITWIKSNCKYDENNLFFLVLLIGSKLADITAQANGYANEVHRAWESIMSKTGNREKHEKWLKFNR